MPAKEKLEVADCDFKTMDAYDTIFRACAKLDCLSELISGIEPTRFVPTENVLFGLHVILSEIKEDVMESGDCLQECCHEAQTAG